MERLENALNGLETAPAREIGEKELGNLISSFGNHEVKTITLLSMRPGIIYTRSDLRRMLLDAQGRNTVWRMDRSVPFGYCQNSLSPIGLVAREVINSDLSTYGYMITDYGMYVGKALGGHLLDFSLRHSKSLIEIFGATQSTSTKSQETKIGSESVEFKKRAPIIRLKIFWELLTSRLPIREIDLENAIGDELYARDHLHNLARLGIINYKTVEEHKPSSFYRLRENKPDGQPEKYKRVPTLTERVYRLFASSSELLLSTSEVYSRLIQIYPDYQQRTKTSLRPDIGGVISHLERQGFLIHEGFRSGVTQSEINLTLDQRIMLCELVEIIDRFQGGDSSFWAEGRRKTQDILADPQKVSRLMTKAKEVSSQANRTSPEELNDWVIQLLTQYPGSTVKELQNYLKQQYGKGLSTRRIEQIITQGKQSIFIPQEKQRGVTYWTVKTG